jgi:hypothetical protein
MYYNSYEPICVNDSLNIFAYKYVHVYVIGIIVNY